MQGFSEGLLTLSYSDLDGGSVKPLEEAMARRRRPTKPISLTSTWLSWRPRVCRFHGLLSADECEALMQLGSSRLERAQVRHAEAVRTAQGCWLPRSDLRSVWSDEQRRGLVQSVEERIAHATGIPLTHGEPAQVLRYGAGQQYSVHPDFFDPRDEQELSNGGQRVATFLVYLSSVPAAAGGATCFPRAGLSVQPSAGDGLLWYNTHVDGRVDAKSVHLSEPVLGGTGAVKWALSKWLRQGRFTVDRETFASEGW